MAMTKEFHKKEVQSYLRGLLQKLDQQVWSKPSFPAEHRPDVDHLSQNLFIGTKPDPCLQIHPHIRPELRESIIAGMRAFELENAENKIAWYDPRNREIIIFPEALQCPEILLQRFIAHEAATDTSCSIQEITSSSYSEDRKSRATLFLKEAFAKKKRPRIRKTRIEKMGFRELLFEGPYAISEIFRTPLILHVNEVYPVIFEIVSAHILKKNGDIDLFDRDSKAGQLGILPYEIYLQFTERLNNTMKYIDWRDILTAFGTGDFYRTPEILEGASSVSVDGNKVFSYLSNGMIIDELNIAQANAMG